MQTLSFIWQTVLYQPLFNALIWLYNGIANQNLGWAVVWLTICLRIVLLPINLVAESASSRRRQADEETERAMKAFKGDFVAQKDETRRIMRKYHVSPWAKVLMLGIQLLVLILLYQVFIRGVNNDRVSKILYPGVAYPGAINTNFYGFDIGFRHDYMWAGIAALYLFVSLIIHNRKESSVSKSDAIYVIMFPLFTFVILWYLPMVKSLFILTTMLFSDSITILRSLVISTFTPKPAATHDSHGGAHH